MKTCFKCNINKPLNKFYKHAQMIDGHLNKCKECTKLDAKKHREENIDKLLMYDRQRANLPHRVAARDAYKNTKNGKESIRRGRKKWNDLNRDKKSAHSKVSQAINNGSLKKEPCSLCGKEETEAHHPDYSKPLCVMWLCQKCHALVHKIEREKNRALAV